ncbi:hypothetical protein [Candidatus Sororendozoicomonas aggregata]
MKTYIFLLAGLARPAGQLEKQMVMYLKAAVLLEKILIKIFSQTNK